MLNDRNAPGQGFSTVPPPPPEAGQPAPPRAGGGVAPIFLPSLLVILAFAAGWFGNAFVNRGDYVAPVSNGQTNEEYVVAQAWNDITQHFVVTSAINQQQMAYDAINAMVATLHDPGHTRFETAPQYQAEQNQLNNAVTVGIGVEVSGGGSQPVRIDEVIPNSPAARAQLQPGDVILAVNGKSIHGLTLDQVVPLVRGTKGTPVTLTIQRTSASGKTSTFNVTMIREPFTAADVWSYLIPGTTIDDIQITQFAQDANSELQQALKSAESQHATGIILDLRGNPGGYLDQAIAVASQFVPAGSGHNVLIEQTRTSQQVDPVQSGGLATTIPLVILIDHDTASAAEITAGAIHVNRPSVQLVGQTTFGTGTVLEPYQLADGSVLLLGTEEYLLPNGHSIYHTGLPPTQAVALPSGVVPLSPLVAQEDHLSVSQIAASRDTQLIQAIHDLGGAGS